MISLIVKNKFSLSIMCMLTLVMCCTDPLTKPDDEVEPPVIIVSVFPDIGTNLTTFQPDLLIVSDSDSVVIGQGYQVRVDYDDDGVPDTDWLDVIPATPTFDFSGPHELVFEIRDSLDIIDTSICTIYVQDLIQVTPTNTSGYGHVNIDWSKDGTNRIAYDTHGGDPWAYQSIFVVGFPDGVPYRVSFHPDSSTYHFDQFPAWSPDGNRITCQSGLGLSIIDVATGEREVVDSRGYYLNSSWSPDGSEIAYLRSSVTVIQNLSTGLIDTLSEDHMAVCWSPDGQTLAAVELQDWVNGKLRFVNAENYSTINEIIIPIHGYKVEYSPEGDWISVGFNSANGTTCIVNANTGAICTIRVDGLANAHNPTWSSDGRMLAFSAKEADKDGVRESIWAIEILDDLKYWAGIAP